MTWRPTVMSWLGEYVPGTIYHAGSVVLDGAWTMIALVESEDRPAPQAFGDPAWESELGDTPAWTSTQTAATTIISGQRYAWFDAGWIRRARLWIPVAAADREHELWMVFNPTTNPRYQQLIGAFTPTTTGWLTVGLGETPIPEGTVFDLLLVTEGTSGTPSSFSAPWDYKQSGGNPSEGEINHQGNGWDMRVNHIDDNDSNQQANLESVQVGGTISAGGFTWTVLLVDPRGDHTRYTVDPATRISENTYTFTFEWLSAITLDYVYITDWYNADHETHAEIKGYFSDEGYDPSDLSKLNENAYGVDIEVQDAYISPDWDFLAHSALFGGGAQTVEQ